VSKCGIADWCGPSDSDPTPIIYLSDNLPVRHEREAFKRVGYRFRCLSHLQVSGSRVVDAQPILDNPRIRIMYDSGAHSLQNKLYRRAEFSRASRSPVRLHPKFDRLHRDLVRGKEPATALSERYGVPVGELRAYRNLYCQNDRESKTNVEQYVEQYVGDYAAFLKSFHPKCQVDFYVTVDYVHDCKVIYEITRRLFDLGANPIPVYHGDDSVDWLKRYWDLGHRLVGISVSEWTKSSDRMPWYYDKVFEFGAKVGMRFHGFMQTGRYMFMYPWWSVDSTSWKKSAAYGNVFDIGERGGRPVLLTCHVSDRAKNGRTLLSSMTGSVLRDLRDTVESRGFDLDQLSKSFIQRAVYNTKVFSELGAAGKGSRRINWKSLF